MGIQEDEEKLQELLIRLNQSVIALSFPTFTPTQKHMYSYGSVEHSLLISFLVYPFPHHDIRRLIFSGIKYWLKSLMNLWVRLCSWGQLLECPNETLTTSWKNQVRHAPLAQTLCTLPPFTKVEGVICTRMCHCSQFCHYNAALYAAIYSICRSMIAAWKNLNMGFYADLLLVILAIQLIS